MAEMTDAEIERFARAVQTLRKYRRAEVRDDEGNLLNESLYVDPLPSNAVHRQMTEDSTAFLIGRKGTGKSTIFIRAQNSLQTNKSAICSYVDIKTVYESAQPSPGVSAKLDQVAEAMSADHFVQHRLTIEFVRSVVSGIREDIEKQLESSGRMARFRDRVTRRSTSIFQRLDSYLEALENPTFTDVQAMKAIDKTEADEGEWQTTVGASLSASPSESVRANVEAKVGTNEKRNSEISYKEILLRTLNIRELILSLQDVLNALDIEQLYVFVDDFSELPENAMRDVVDVLIAPLNNWSNELIKFKIAAYPGRIYYGDIDKSKIDEVSIDLYELYGKDSYTDMVERGVDFTKRLILRRLDEFDLGVEDFFEDDEATWQALFEASSGNPRVLGYTLHFAYQDRTIYGRKINSSAVAEAAKRYYLDIIDAYFKLGKFLHESFDERSSIYSLKELLEGIVERAKGLRSKSVSKIFEGIAGRHPTSHFHVAPTYDRLLSTLELNFFVTKYYQMRDKKGRLVSVYALNYGLCADQSIAFGKPEGRDYRTYHVERMFNYDPILQEYLRSNQEIRCGNCRHIFDYSDVDALRRFGMLCPECLTGTCEISNVSRKYEDVLKRVDAESLLPATELGILQSLNVTDDQFANEIASDLDVSYQLVGRRASKLARRNLVQRLQNGSRPIFRLTSKARDTYFDDGARS